MAISQGLSFCARNENCKWLLSGITSSSANATALVGRPHCRLLSRVVCYLPTAPLKRFYFIAREVSLRFCVINLPVWSNLLRLSPALLLSGLWCQSPVVVFRGIDSLFYETRTTALFLSIAGYYHVYDQIISACCLCTLN